MREMLDALLDAYMNAGPEDRLILSSYIPQELNRIALTPLDASGATAIEETKAKDADAPRVAPGQKTRTVSAPAAEPPAAAPAAKTPEAERWISVLEKHLGIPHHSVSDSELLARGEMALKDTDLPEAKRNDISNAVKALRTHILPGSEPYSSAQEAVEEAMDVNAERKAEKYVQEEGLAQLRSEPETGAEAYGSEL